MKRAFAAAAFGGLLMVLVPQAAFAGTSRPVAPYDHNAEHNGESAEKTAEGTDQPEQSAPDSGPRQGDHEQRDSDGGEILF